MKLTDKVKLSFVDTNIEVVNSMAKLFGREENCEFLYGDIFQQGPGSLVSPANRKGNMDGGIDRVYSDKFPSIENRLRAYINQDHGGILEFGDAQIVPTDDKNFPYIVFSPTVNRPGDLSEAKNVYLASKAIFEEVYKYNLKSKESKKINRLLMPGLGTYYGGLEPIQSAICVYKGYEDFKKYLSLEEKDRKRIKLDRKLKDNKKFMGNF